MTLDHPRGESLRFPYLRGQARVHTDIYTCIKSEKRRDDGAFGVYCRAIGHRERVAAVTRLPACGARFLSFFSLRPLGDLKKSTRGLVLFFPFFLSVLLR